MKEREKFIFKKKGLELNSKGKGFQKNKLFKDLRKQKKLLEKNSKKENCKPKIRILIS